MNTNTVYFQLGTLLGIVIGFPTGYLMLRVRVWMLRKTHEWSPPPTPPMPPLSEQWNLPKRLPQPQPPQRPQPWPVPDGVEYLHPPRVRNPVPWSASKVLGYNYFGHIHPSEYPGGKYAYPGMIDHRKEE